MLLPLCTLDEVREELAETEKDLNSMHAVPVVVEARWQELWAKRVRRRGLLLEQIAEMEVAGV